MGHVAKCGRAVLAVCIWMMTSCDHGASLRAEALSDLQEVEDSEHMQDESVLGRLQRKLLIEDEGHAVTNGNASRVAEDTSSSPWPVLVGLLVSALSVAFVIMLAVRFRLVQRFFGGYTEALLPDGDTASQFSQAGTLTANFPAHGMREREVYTIGHQEDDDGFIEDNYIPSGDKQRAAREVEQVATDEDSDDELDLHFSIE